MAKYMIVYKGKATDLSDMSQEDMQAVMMQWGAWMEGLGTAMVDMGQPFGSNSSVVDDGSAGNAADLSGYSILEADSMDAARAMATGHPFLSDAAGEFAIDIYEMMPAPGM